jgi:hypothetical protein
MTNQASERDARASQTTRGQGAVGADPTASVFATSPPSAKLKKQPYFGSSVFAASQEEEIELKQMPFNGDRKNVVMYKDFNDFIEKASLETGYGGLYIRGKCT